MEKFETVFRGYNKDQVKSYFDEVITVSKDNKGNSHID